MCGYTSRFVRYTAKNGNEILYFPVILYYYEYKTKKNLQILSRKRLAQLK
jgi:hypothetical protein